MGGYLGYTIPKKPKIHSQEAQNHSQEAHKPYPGMPKQTIPRRRSRQSSCERGLRKEEERPGWPSLFFLKLIKCDRVTAIGVLNRSLKRVKL